MSQYHLFCAQHPAVANFPTFESLERAASVYEKLNPVPDAVLEYPDFTMAALVKVVSDVAKALGNDPHMEQPYLVRVQQFTSDGMKSLLMPSRVVFIVRRAYSLEQCEATETPYVDELVRRRYADPENRSTPPGYDSGIVVIAGTPFSKQWRDIPGDALVSRLAAERELSLMERLRLHAKNEFDAGIWANYGVLKGLHAKLMAGVDDDNDGLLEPTDEQVCAHVQWLLKNLHGHIEAASTPQTDELGRQRRSLYACYATVPARRSESDRKVMPESKGPFNGASLPSPQDILDVFKDTGMNMDATLNGLYSVRGQLAQVINGGHELLRRYAGSFVALDAAPVQNS